MHLKKITLVSILMLSFNSQAFTVETKKINPTYDNEMKSIMLANQTVRFINTSTNIPMSIFQHQGNFYLAGNHNDSYSISICPNFYRSNHPNYNKRTLNVISVDGLNIITGQPAGYNQPGYVINPNSSCTQIKGWRKSMHEEAKFTLTSPNNSYAERTNNNTTNIGVIGFASFLEKNKTEHLEPVSPSFSNMREAARSYSVPSSASESSEMIEQKQKLGTGHGDKVVSHAQQTSFEKESQKPNRVLQIYYDSYENLLAKGIIRPRVSKPNPFPESGFAPDPIR